MQYIKNNAPQYDWCFVIDNDEFITLENPADKINVLLTKYEAYEAVILSWQCYGASGHVEKPDYNNSGVVATYTEKIKGYAPACQPEFLTKTCYNLKKYDVSSACYVH